MTELLREGKYKDGKKVAPVRIALPFQTIETINESAADRSRLAAGGICQRPRDPARGGTQPPDWGRQKIRAPLTPTRVCRQGQSHLRRHVSQRVAKLSHMENDMLTVSLKNFKQNAAAFLNKSRKNREPIFLENNSYFFALLRLEDYNSLMETLYLLQSDAKWLKESIQQADNGQLIPLEQVHAKLGLDPKRT
ncbi:MAG: type II toxin-antitoxin system Phd/YefM family antitoxin [candidate division KSB1 bacterium]|nr:type II toxin-antitoxin system Phd/YefM family antitoxin [candidate division KSB1 bacterium]MDZ7300715.1 type II toxin-antitoxin system Phd/YefM family antitoxin [candidate division KSB1 bacterium]MDZ7310015.1 type II toxin-antitoxin system Phd/YefM family antitoxin [candidate division KSB1 bacterium]